MPRRGYTDEEEKFLSRLVKEHQPASRRDWGQKIRKLYLEKFPEPDRSGGALQAQWLRVLRRSAGGKPKRRKVVNGQLQRLIQWFQRVAARADKYHAERDGLAEEVQKFRHDNRALKRANAQLTGQLQRVQRIAEIFQRPSRSPRVEAAKVQHGQN